MKISKKLAVIATSVSLVAGAAWADGHVNKGIEAAVKARQAMMQLYSYNLGQLGAMAKTTVPYDAEAASKSAGNLLTLMSIDQSTMWPQGSDTPTIEGTAALPAIWEKYPDIATKGMALNEAVIALNAAAGTDLASLQGAMKPVGEACGACHKAYRKPAK
jgi:cytochrome c556